MGQAQGDTAGDVYGAEGGERGAHRRRRGGRRGPSGPAGLRRAAGPCGPRECPRLSTPHLSHLQKPSAELMSVECSLYCKVRYNFLLQIFSDYLLSLL